MSADTSTITHGTGALTVQPGGTIIEKYDGKLEGTLVYAGALSALSTAPYVGASHPIEVRLRVHQRTIKYTSSTTIEVTCTYIGITGTSTTPVANHAGASGQRPITQHPDFTTLAGDPLALNADGTSSALTLREITNTDGTKSSFLEGENGAAFDPIYRTFIGFLDPKNKLRGVTTYVTPGDQVTLTYWKLSEPSYTNRGKVKTNIPDARENSAVTNWLCIEILAQEVGHMFQVTEVWLGSDTEAGWDTDIYGS